MFIPYTSSKAPMLCLHCKMLFPFCISVISGGFFDTNKGLILYKIDDSDHNPSQEQCLSCLKLDYYLVCKFSFN